MPGRRHRRARRRSQCPTVNMPETIGLAGDALPPRAEKAAQTASGTPGSQKSPTGQRISSCTRAAAEQEAESTERAAPRSTPTPPRSKHPPPLGVVPVTSVSTADFVAAARFAPVRPGRSSNRTPAWYNARHPPTAGSAGADAQVRRHRCRQMHRSRLVRTTARRRAAMVAQVVCHRQVA